MWKPAQFGRRRVGCDVSGDEYAFALRRTTGGREWDAYIHPIGCGDPKGEWLNGAWPTAEDAMDAADRYVVAHIDSAELWPGEPR